MNHLLQGKLTFESGIILFTLMLLIGDMVFIALHTLNAFVLSGGSIFFDIGHDRGVAEFFQYLKYIWVMLLLVLIAVRYKQLAFLVWCPVFVYLLLDDAVKIHETVGGMLAANINAERVMGLRLQDYGELIVSFCAAVIVLTPVAIAMLKGSSEFRKASLDLGFLIGLLAFFGIVVDMLHVALPVGRVSYFVLGAIEDGGEMFAGSLMVAYALVRMSSKESHYWVSTLWSATFNRKLPSREAGLTS